MKVRVDQDIAPLKFLILIKPNSSQELLKAIKSLSSLWAGVFSPILPFYKKLPTKFRQYHSINLETFEYYKNSIANYDPDIIIFSDNLDDESIKKLAGERSIQSLNTFYQSICDGKPLYGIGIEHVLKEILEKEFKYVRQDSLKLSIPKIKNQNLFLSSFIGNVVPKMYDEIIIPHFLEKDFYEDFDLTYKNLEQLFNQDLITTLHLGYYDLRIIPKKFYHKKEVCFIIDPNNKLDIINYWNLRSLGWRIMPVPYTKINEDPFIEILLEKLIRKSKNKKHFNLLDILIGENLNTEETLNELQEVIKKNKINVSLSHQHWFPRYWSIYEDELSYDSVIPSRIIYDFKNDEFEIKKNDFLQFKLPKTPFETSLSNHSLLKSYVSFSYENEQGEYAEIIKDISTEDWVRITRGDRLKYWRIGNDGIIKYIIHSEESGYIYLPKSFDFYKTYFKNKGLSIVKVSSSKLADEILKNIGGLHGINILSTTGAIKIIEKFEGGKPIAIEHLIAEIQKNKPYFDIRNPNDVIQLFIDKKIIEFGVTLKCQICDQVSFYELNSLKDNIKCPICSNHFQVPKNDPKNTFKFAYKGVGPFSRNNKVDGLLCVLLTLRLFRLDLLESYHGFSFLMDFEVKLNQESSYEIDLAIIGKHYRDKDYPKTFFCECKTYKSIAEKDIDRLIFIGEKFPNSILVVSTLNEEFNADEKVLIKKLVNNFRKNNSTISTNPVLLLTAQELIPKDRFFSLKEFTDEIPQYEHADYFQILSDLTCKKHLGLKTCGEFYSEEMDRLHQLRIKSKK